MVGASLAGVDSFKGIPYAQPPVGKLRLKPPQPITSNIGTVLTVGIPKSCPQLLSSTAPGLLPLLSVEKLLNNPLFQTLTNIGEDCLTMNVQRPATANENSKLPVVFWMYGGGFAFGSTATYDATELVLTSIAQGKDVIYVSVNYRLGGFGYLAGAEILKDGSANIGFLDQRLGIPRANSNVKKTKLTHEIGLKWVADNVAKFGGDPDKVTIWGESAGAISVFDHMAAYDGDHTYKGKPLFRAGIMNSGSIIPTNPVDCPRAQEVYDKVVAEAGCSAAADTLDCLRGVDYETFLNAANSVPGILGYNSVALSYLPRPDGVILTNSPDILNIEGKYAKVPFIIGDQEDEGTLFSLAQTNITTTARLVDYFKSIFFQDATLEQVQGLVATYPNDITAGSPFNTGILNSIYPQYKRLAAIVGDVVFTLTRRIFLKNAIDVNPTVPCWSYLSSYGYGTPILGTLHASDILQIYGILPGIPSSTIQKYYISFFNTMDPNEGTTGLITWPKWNENNQLVHFLATGTKLLKDDFRSKSYKYLTDNIGSLHF